MDQLNFWGYVFIGIYIAVMLIFAYLTSKKASQSVESHFLAGRSMHPAVIAVSFLAASASAGVFLGEPGLAYEVGLPALWAPLPLVTGYIVTAMLYTTRLRKLSVSMSTYTLPDFLGSRYNSDAVRIILALITIIFYTVTMIAQFTGAGILFNTFLGIPFNVSVIGFSVIIAIYVSIGGFRAIANMDTINAIPMVLFSLILIIVTLVMTGGMSGLSAGLTEIGPELSQMFEPSMYSPWGIVGLYVFWIIIFMSNPYLSTKLMAMRDTKKSTMRIYLYMVLVLGLIINLTYIVGLGGRVLYPDIENPDYATVTMAVEFLPAVLAAFLMIGVLAAIISTLNALLLLVGQSVSEDIYRKTFNPNASDKSVLRITKVTIAITTIVIMIFTVWRTPDLLAIFIYVGTSGVGIAVAPQLLIGLFWKRATKWGALMSMLIGVPFYSALVLFSDLGTFVEILLGAIVSFSTMIIVSLFTSPPKDNKLNF